MTALQHVVQIDLAGPGARLAKRYANEAQEAAEAATAELAVSVGTAREYSETAQFWADDAQDSATTASTAAGSVSSGAATAAAAASAAETALAAVLAAIAGETITNAIGILAANRTALKAVNDFTVPGAFLLEGERFGFFTLTTYAGNEAAVNEDTQEGVYVRSTANTANVWMRADLRILKPEFWGALGNSTADPAAFLGLNKHLARVGGGEIHLTAGRVYEPFTQTGGSSASLGYYGTGFYRAPEAAFCLYPPAGLTTEQKEDWRIGKRLIIRPNGATIKFNDGLKFGSFNTTTGDPLGFQTSDKSKLAAPGYVVFADYVETVIVEGLRIDGNFGAMVVGSGFGDSGHQVAHTGFEITSSLNVTLNHNIIEDMGCDGIVTIYMIIDEEDVGGRFDATGNQIRRCGRNNVSYTGGRNGLFVGNVLENPGYAPNASVSGGFVSTAPGSCFDIEAEGGAKVRGLTIRDGFHFQGAHGSTALVGDSGDSEGVTVQNCDLIGLVWPKKPGFRFENCRVNGKVIAPWPARDEDDNPDPDITKQVRFRGGYISDRGRLGLELAATNAIDTAGAPVHLDGVVLDITRFIANLNGARLTDCTINVSANTVTVASGSAILQNAGGVWRNVRVVESIASNLPATPYYVPTNADIRDCDLESPNTKLFWRANSSASGGYIGGVNPNTYTSGTFDPAPLADGARDTADIIVPGAVLGDIVTISHSANLSGANLFASVVANNTVRRVIENNTGGAVNPSAGSFTVRVHTKS
jgi:hypothetical protein